MHLENIQKFPASPAGCNDRPASPCRLLAAGIEIPVMLRGVSAVGAFVETAEKPAIDSIVRLRHPEAGEIRARVARIAADGVALVFTPGDPAATFALVAIATDMTVPGAAARMQGA